jgi:hypothetical protein
MACKYKQESESRHQCPLWQEDKGLQETLMSSVAVNILVIFCSMYITKQHIEKHNKAHRTVQNIEVPIYKVSLGSSVF